MVMNTINERITDNMNSAIPLLHPIALMNQDPQLQGVYIDVENGVALAGFRRQVANFGVMLVRANYERSNLLELGMNRIRHNGVYHYVHQDYFETNEGLLGSEIREGYREAVNTDAAREKFDAIRELTAFRFSAELNPGKLNSFIQQNKEYLSRSTRNFENTKINFQFTAETPKFHLPAKAHVARDGGIIMEVQVPSLNGPKLMAFNVDKNSTIAERRIKPGLVYMVKTASKEQRTVDVVQLYKFGIRVAVQHFKMGLIRPGEKAYSVNPDITNGITPKSVVDVPFMRTQDIRMLLGAPMLTFDLDMIASLMQTLKSHEKVTMEFRDAVSGVYFKAEGDDYKPTIEAILGPTIPYVRGKVWCP